MERVTDFTASMIDILIKPYTIATTEIERKQCTSFWDIQNLFMFSDPRDINGSPTLNTVALLHKENLNLNSNQCFWIWQIAKIIIYSKQGAHALISYLFFPFLIQPGNRNNVYIIRFITQAVLILTGLNSALCCKSRAGNTQIGNKKDCISCCDSKFHATRRSSVLCLSLYRTCEYIQAVVILTGLNSALWCEKQSGQYRDKQ